MKGKHKTPSIRLLTWGLLLTFFLPSLNSCCDLDEKTNVNELSKELAGLWYTEYARTGTVSLDNAGNGSYNSVVQALRFNTDGTGNVYKFYFNGDINSAPVAMFGGALDKDNGSFTYTSTSDGIVTLMRKGKGNSDNPQTWIMHYADGQLSSADGDTDITMSHASKSYEQHLVQWEAMVRGNGNDDATSSNFLTNWENMKTVTISGEDAPRDLPWIMEANCNMPDGIRYNVSKAKGWEMAFCELNDKGASTHRYFALYNKYSGQLRVFVWIPNPSSFGNKVVFRIGLGGYYNKYKYPFYNALEFGVPTNHEYRTNLNPDVVFTQGIEQAQSFECLVSPYTYNENLSQGWMAFDIDMSGYVPAGINWRDVENPATNSLLIITPQFSETTKINMTGNLKGTADGTFTNPQYIKHGGENDLAGVSSLLGALSGACNSKIANANAYWLVQNNPKAGGFTKGSASVLYYANMGFSTAATMLPLFGSTSPEYYDTIPGKIDLNINETLDLTGYLVTDKSSDFSPFNIGKDLIDRGNTAKGNMGNGVWSLAEDPVVYVSKDDLLANTDEVKIDVMDDNGTMMCGSFNENDIRLVSFLDPTSIKVNLNTSLLHDVKDVNVVATYGVFNGRNLGHTDIFRQFLTLDGRPTIDIRKGAKKGSVITLDGNSSPALHWVENGDIIGKEPSVIDISNCSLVNQGDNMHYFGQQFNIANTTVVPDPMVYLPYKKGNGDIYTVWNPVVPDFVVSVTVTFQCNEGRFMYSKRFLPRIELIGNSDLAKHYNAIKAFSDKASAQKATGTLSNNSAIPVTSNGMEMLLSKTLEMLNIIK